MIIRSLFIFSLSIIFSGFMHGRNNVHINDTYGDGAPPVSTKFNAVLQKIEKQKQEPTNNLMIEIALQFLNTPYVASTLEKNETEQLIINLEAFDCMTFVETCLAFSRTFHSENPNFDTYKNELTSIRYRDGIINGYTSRLHYTSDWIFDNQKKGVIYDKTKDIGGIILPLHVDYMSTHPTSYTHLATHPEDIPEIKKIEDNINKRTYYYIPKEDIGDYEQEIEPGDIICFVTSIKGLDISHLGIAYQENKKLTFIHASTNAKKVIINPVSVSAYCKNIKHIKGVMILKCN